MGVSRPVNVIPSFGSSEIDLCPLFLALLAEGEPAFFWRSLGADFVLVWFLYP